MAAARALQRHFNASRRSRWPLSFGFVQKQGLQTARLESVDVLRGAVIVLMALDHVRAFWGTSGWDPPLTAGNLATFATRWITHFCAPVFVLLAGTGASLSLGRGRSKRDLARFLLTRGAWLALLDVTLISFAWFFRIGDPFVTDVMWVIGCSMIVLAGLVRLPVQFTIAFGLILVVGHNALDPIRASSLGDASWIWIILHEPGVIRLPWGATWYAAYPLVPWVGVMALGYALGSILSGDSASRRRRLMLLGGGMVVAFVVLRATNLYGDPVPWSIGPNVAITIASFVNTEKYPPSLLYLLMTIGPAMIALAAMDRVRPRPDNALLVFGRVPLFFYVVHLYVIHLAAALAFMPRLGPAAFGVDPGSPPPEFGVGLALVYLIWAVAVVALYPLCRWFTRVKQQHRGSGWISYV